MIFEIKKIIAKFFRTLRTAKYHLHSNFFFFTASLYFNIARTQSSRIQFYSFGCMNIRGMWRGSKRQRITNLRVNDRVFLSLTSIESTPSIAVV